MLVPLLKRDGGLSGLLVSGRGQLGMVRDLDEALPLTCWEPLNQPLCLGTAELVCRKCAPCCLVPVAAGRARAQGAQPRSSHGVSRELREH